MSDRQPIECPNCGHGESLWSDEPASIMYTIKLYRDGAGGLDVEYTGMGHDPMDEGTEYVGDIWCRGCGKQFTEADFGIERSARAYAATVVPPSVVATLWVELLAAHVASDRQPQLERRQMARSYRNGMVAVYARVTGQAEETVYGELDAAIVAAHEQSLVETGS